jgi:hypothetical protein
MEIRSTTHHAISLCSITSSPHHHEKYLHGGKKSRIFIAQTQSNIRKDPSHPLPECNAIVVQEKKQKLESLLFRPILSSYSTTCSSLSHALLAPNNPKLTAQSFSPITGVESETISQFRSGKGVSFRSTFGGGRAGPPPPPPPPVPCTGGCRRARARCCCVCVGTALEAKARFGVVDDADALDEPRRERTLGSVCGIWRARVLRVSSGRASACRTATSWM